MKNLRLTLLYLLAGYIFPLLPQLDKLLHYKTGILMLACIVMLSWANPEIRISEGKSNALSDKGTMVVIFLMGYLALVAPVLEWGYFLGDNRLTFWTLIGIVLITSGLWYRIYVIQTLGRHFTGVVRQVEEHHLVTNGPYRLIRHPSYLGSVIAFAGCAIVLEAWTGLVISAISMLIAYYLRIQAEEKLLLNIFGSQYHDYQQKTWKMIPYVW